MSRKSPAPLASRTLDIELVTWYRYVRVLRKITARLDQALRALRVNRPQFGLLMQIVFDEGINQQTCAERMNVTKGNVAQHVSWLEGQGLIRRQKKGRANHLHLTEAGAAVVAEIMPVHDQQVKEILAVLSPAELRQFQAILRKIDRHLT